MDQRDLTNPRHRRLGLAAALLILGGTTLIAQNLSTEHYNQLRFRHIGPVGNRISSVAGIAGDRSTYFAGAASGGVWKTSDAGLTWSPVFDDQTTHSIGALAVSPSDTSVVWAGTGESFIRSNVSIGDGVYRSTDGGKTWQQRGLKRTGRIARIIVHPTNPDLVYVAALGHGYSPQKDRGIYRTADGGRSWERILSVDEETGASDLAMDPNNPRILFAGMWQLKIRTWVRESGGPGSGLFVSRDGGDTWTKLEGKGLPKPPLGKIAVCTTPEDSDRIYALIETGDGVPWQGKETDNGELWRSDDGGESWQLVSYSHHLAGRTAYYSRCAVAPDDADEAYFLSSDFTVTNDGGKTETAITTPKAPGWDHHDMWIDPTDGDRMVVGHDGGVSISENRGKSWLRVQLPVAQMYHVTVDNDVPYNVYGNRQDGPSVRGPSNSRLQPEFGLGGGIPRGMWHAVGGGESGFATPDPTDSNIVWSSTSGYGPVGGIVSRYDERTRQYRQLDVWPESTIGWPPEKLKYRFQWTFPLLISPHDNNTVYVSSQYVHRTTNGGQSWEVISPDLTTNDKSKQGISGGLTPDNIGVEYCCVVYALDESPVAKGVLWAGTNDGLIHISRDGGENWVDVTENLPGLPPLGTVRNIDASKWEAGKAYVTVDFHQVGIFDPYVYKTEDYGQSWSRITSGVAEGPLSYARNIREDPVRPGLLYLGTENTLYVSFNDGENWQVLQNNLPHTPMYWIVVQEHFNDLVVGTYGRGFWILDDLTPLQQVNNQIFDSEVHLFEPRPAYRFRPITEPMTMFDDPSAGENPPYGASINYWLKEESEEKIRIRISDSSGGTVRVLEDKNLEGKSQAGINRVWWDLQQEPSQEILLRTRPPYADWVSLDKDGKRSSPLPRISVLAPPGKYTVTLQIGEAERSTTLEVLKDPNSEGSEADIQLQTQMLTDIQEDMNRTARMINRLEWLRSQLLDLKTLAEKKQGEGKIAKEIDSLEAKFRSVEEDLFQMKITGTGQDPIRWPSMLTEKLAFLANSVAIGDFPPTDQHREVHQLLKTKLDLQQSVLEGLLKDDLQAFNQLLRGRQLDGVVVVEEAESEQ